jgi:YgiT-type zinc finger domain-containing protein
VGHLQTRRGSTGCSDRTLEREGTMLIVRSVPAQVCQNCGEEYINEDITATPLQQAEEAVRTGVQVNIRTYVVTQV